MVQPLPGGDLDSITVSQRIKRMSAEPVRVWDAWRNCGSVPATMAILLFACMLAAAPADGQQGAKAGAETTAGQAGAAPKAGDVTVPRPGILYDKDLDLHFNYPVEMHAVNANAAVELGHESIYGVSGDDDPVHQEAIRCARPLLNADLAEDKAPQRDADLGEVWVDDSEAYKKPRKPEPIFATILLAEIVRDCLPKKLQKNDDNALCTIALSFVSEPGIQHMLKPLWYEVGKQKVHMNSGAGRLIVNGQLAPAPIIVMSMATKWRGHLLACVFTSNDKEIFNEITKSLVQFGNGSWGPIFAANIGPKGSGNPMTILPK